MMIKAGVWNNLTFLEKQNLLVHYAYQTKLGREYLNRKAEEKNKSLCMGAQGL